MTVNEVASSIWGAVGVGLTVIGAVIVAVINTRSTATKREIEQAENVKLLSEKIDTLETEFKSLKDSFTLVCDQMELDGTMTPQLKHFRKLFKL